MALLTITFPVASTQEWHDDQATDILCTLLGAWRMNGQILGHEWNLTRSSIGYHTAVLCPEPTALQAIHENQAVRTARDAIQRYGLLPMIVDVLGATDLDTDTCCPCTSSSSYILYTHAYTLAPPLRCGDCFHPLPLYTLPKKTDDAYAGILCWQSDYHACDTLFLNSRVLEQTMHRQLSQHMSALTSHGVQECQHIEQMTQKPTYYYLYRYFGRSLRNERQRRCPRCRKAWVLATPWHRFDFRCVDCRLVSTIACDVQE